jgi:hypothetical protein
MKKGGIVKYAIIYKMVSIISFMLFSIMLLAQASKSRQDILDLISNANNQPHYGGFIESYLQARLGPSDVPLIYNFVFDKTIDYDMRISLARVAAALKPDKQQIDRVINFAIQHLPEWDTLLPRSPGQVMAGPIMPTIDIFYKNTQDDKILAPFREFYDDKSCGAMCKEVIIEMLSDTKASQNIELYKKILQDPQSAVSLKQSAALALARINSREPPPRYIAPM